MAKFLNTSATNYFLEELIKDARDRLVLISPFLKLNDPEGGRALTGQTVATDRIVLSWRDVDEAGARQDGYNVVVHEVVHFLDHASGGRASAQGGAMEREYQALCDAVDDGEETLIDPYGAEDPVEFLAVSAELFFEQPRRLRRHHPDLYAALRDAFRLDPADWPPPRAGQDLARD